VAAPPVPSRRLVILLVVTAVALMTIDVRGFGPLDRARELTLGATRPARDLIGWVASPVVDGWRGMVLYDDVVAENAELRSRIAELEGALDRAPEAEEELARLLRATDIPFIGDIPTVVARVVADRDTGLERLIEIDKGSDDGLGSGMAVVTGRGLVGRLELVTPRRAVVRLITQPQFSLGVRSRAGAIGVARGDGNGKNLTLELSEARLELARDGQRFETTGLDRSVFPPGLPVGRLVGDPNQDDEVWLEPLADLDRLEFVSVVLWEPTQ
jgi:rod shape-determining protein MreC